MSIYVPVKTQYLLTFKAVPKNPDPEQIYVLANIYGDIRGMIDGYGAIEIIDDINRGLGCVYPGAPQLGAEVAKCELPSLRFTLECPYDDEWSPFDRDTAVSVGFTNPSKRTFSVFTVQRFGKKFKVVGLSSYGPGHCGLGTDNGTVEVMSGLVLFSFCKLISAKNVVAIDKRYTAQEQREWRRASGPKALPRYRILTINRPTFLTDSNDHDSEGGEHEPEKRRHHVRGHFRTYRHERYRPEQRGTYWIRPHWRGSEALGVIDTPVHVRKAEAAK